MPLAFGSESGQGMRDRMGWESTEQSHTYHTLILVQHLIVLAQADQEDQRGNVFEAVNPFFFRSLR